MRREGLEPQTVGDNSNKQRSSIRQDDVNLKAQ